MDIRGCAARELQCHAIAFVRASSTLYSGYVPKVLLLADPMFATRLSTKNDLRPFGETYRPKPGVLMSRTH